MTADPRYATPPAPGATHAADALDRIASSLGTPLMPWQRQVAHVATERDPADPRRYRYQTVIVSVPRQSGKTTLMRAELVRRTLAYSDHLAFYTAQTGKDARQRWRDLVSMVNQSPLAPYATVRRSNGEESLSWPNASALRTFAPRSASLHGYTPHTVMLDEAWEYDEAQGDDLLGAILPAQVTLPDRQLWIVSTMGDAGSTWFHRLIDDARASVDDPAARTAYFEWSADPDADLYDPAVWRSFHPALGHTVTEADLTEHAAQATPGTWSRGYCNLRTITREALVTLERWASLADPTLRGDRREVAIAYDVAHDRSESAILAGWCTETGVACRVIRSAPGAAWVADAVQQLRAEWHPRATVADDGGPARDVTDTLRRANVDVQTLTARDYGTACGAFLRHITDGTLTHDGSQILTDAMMAAVLRPFGDAVAFSRRASRGSIAALVAATVAVRAAEHAPAPVPPPLIVGAA